VEDWVGQDPGEGTKLGTGDIPARRAWRSLFSCKIFSSSSRDRASSSSSRRSLSCSTDRRKLETSSDMVPARRKSRTHDTRQREAELQHRGRESRALESTGTR